MVESGCPMTPATPALPDEEPEPEELPVAPALEPVAPALEPVAPALEPVAPALEPVEPALEPVAPVLEPVAPALEPAFDVPLLMVPVLDMPDEPEAAPLFDPEVGFPLVPAGGLVVDPHATTVRPTTNAAALRFEKLRMNVKLL
jgi:hypothetical protein